MYSERENLRYEQFIKSSEMISLISFILYSTSQASILKASCHVCNMTYAYIFIERQNNLLTNENYEERRSVITKTPRDRRDEKRSERIITSSLLSSVYLAMARAEGAENGSFLRSCM